MNPDELLRWLRELHPERLMPLWQLADDVRRSHVGDEVHLRGLVEISNHCARQCLYCGIRASNRNISRYRMGDDEIVACAEQARGLGYGTVVLQAGEDDDLTADGVAEIVRRIKQATDLAVTLSLGERTIDDLAAWRRAGADRYLLRFETSNTELFERIHPPGPGKTQSRLSILMALRRLGYEVGSGVMVGIPGQRYDDLVADLLLFRELDLDMIGIGPFIPHPATPLGAVARAPEDVPADEPTTYKMVALARIMCPEANIPSTTALATLNLAEGREFGLRRGANVMMPNLTPPSYRAKYEIYPKKACVLETADACNGCMRARIEALGRRVGEGPGNRRHTEPARAGAHVV
jgi:biotin synthase